MPNPSVTYTFSNSTTADATQINQNFTDLINGATDGTKDYSINALTAAGTATLNGNVVLGVSSTKTITVNGSLSSSIPIGTDAAYDIGSSTFGIRSIYFGGNSQRLNIKASASMSATWTLTLPVTAGSANAFLVTDGSGVSSWTTTLHVGGNTTSDTNLGTIDNVSLTSFYEGHFSASVSGAYTATQGLTVFYSKIGKTVTLLFPDGIFATNSADYLRAASATIPSSLLPKSNIQASVIVESGGVRQVDPGEMDILTTGAINIYCTAGLGNFANSGNGGFWGLAVTYLTA